MRSLMLIAVLAAPLTGACAKKRIEAPAPLARLDEARHLTRTGKWTKALPMLQRLAFDLPAGRPELAEVSYLTGEAFFQTGAFTEAAGQFHQVADQFPETPYAPLGLLRAGDANLRQWRKPQLDPTYGEAALGVYQELVGRYPDSEAASRANVHVRRLRNWFAEKTYLNGMFYLRRKAFDSAIIYFKDVVANYSDTRWAPDALLRLIDSYHAIGYAEEKKETCEHLRRYYPTVRVSLERCPAAPAPATGASP